jgi:hypothetical protein
MVRRFDKMRYSRAIAASFRQRKGVPPQRRSRYLSHRTRCIFLSHCESPKLAVRPDGANHQWRKIPPGELSIDPVADEQLGRATGRAGAS